MVWGEFEYGVQWFGGFASRFTGFYTRVAPFLTLPAANAAFPVMSGHKKRVKTLAARVLGWKQPGW